MLQFSKMAMGLFLFGCLMPAFKANLVYKVQTLKRRHKLFSKDFRELCDTFSLKNPFGAEWVDSSIVSTDGGKTYTLTNEGKTNPSCTFKIQDFVVIEGNRTPVYLLTMTGTGKFKACNRYIKDIQQKPMATKFYKEFWDRSKDSLWKNRKWKLKIRTLKYCDDSGSLDYGRWVPAEKKYATMKLNTGTGKDGKDPTQFKLKYNAEESIRKLNFDTSCRFTNDKKDNDITIKTKKETFIIMRPEKALTECDKNADAFVAHFKNMKHLANIRNKMKRRRLLAISPVFRQLTCGQITAK